jgi:hypothetical protein
LPLSLALAFAFLRFVILEEDPLVLVLFACASTTLAIRLTAAFGEK